MICRDTSIRNALRARRFQRGFLLLPALGAGRAGDPNFASVLSLMHFDGANGSTTITDQKGLTWTVAGNAQISTAQSVFGGASLLLDGSGDSLANSGAGWNILGGNWTIEVRVRFNVLSGNNTVLQIGADVNNRLVVYAFGGNTLALYTIAGVGTGANRLTTAITTNTWYALKLTRSGTTIAMGVNTTSLGTTSPTMPAGSSAAHIGFQGFSSNDYANCYLDEWRITAGVARDPGIYAPASVAFPDS